MQRVVVSVALAVALTCARPARSDPAPEAAPATAGASIIEVKDQAELNEKWCAADPTVEHVIVLPAALFVDSQQLACNGDIYRLYRIIERDDQEDFDYFLDPPFAQKTRLGCDGKAGRTMQTIAINCRPLKAN